MRATRTFFAQSIHELDEHTWDLIAGKELMMSHRWHRVMEACRRRYRPRYAFVEDARGPLAIAATAAATPVTLPGGWRDRLAAALTLTFGAPFSSSVSGIAVRPDTPLATALPEIEVALRGLCWRERRPLVGVANVAAHDLTTFRARGFVPVPRPATMVLDLGGATYDSYVGGLRKEDRSELRRARRRAEEHAVRLRRAPVRETGEDVYSLLAEVWAHHGISADQLPIDDQVFPALRREMPDDTYVISGSLGEQLAGFVVCFAQRDALLAPMIGLRYQLSMPSCLYAVLIDEVVRLGLRLQLPRIYLGIGNERQKRRHGFLPQPRWACIRAPFGPVNVALEAAAARVSASPSI
ncbi:MAG: GNAT family N-acetyltransferase [Chloroflexi bacterium]|nr:GNAT family N-acetyltransferase [Chloroflexota bacterium]